MMKTSPCQAIEFGTCGARLAVEAGAGPRGFPSAAPGIEFPFLGRWAPRKAKRKRPH